MVGSRDTPPSIQDGPYGYEPDAISNFEGMDNGDGGRTLTDSDAQKIGREIWQSSTNWINSGRRARWNDSLRAFQSLHPSGSKYLSGDYRYRSTMFRPKTRAMVRRDEAATASAFFSNEDVVSITAADDDNPMQQASAEVLKALLQYRLADGDHTATIPWFQTLIGARQDAEVMGICVGKAEWDYEERYIRTEMRPRLGPDGQPIWEEQIGTFAFDSVDLYEKVHDRPRVDLLAPENFRFEPGCDWRDPIRTSPYLIELVPVYIQDAMELMDSHRGMPAQWRRVAESALRGAVDLSDDATRRTRETGRVPGKDHDAWKPAAFDICWTRLNVVRWGGQDWVYRTLAGGGEILQPPRPIKEVWRHGERPYVVGCVVLETHKTYPSSKVELTSDLQRAANQDWNSRFDAMMLSLQPRQFVREGSGADVNDLRMFMPGKVVQVQAKSGEPMQNVITWDRPPDPSEASYAEQDRINLDWDDLTGAFTNSSVQASQVQQQSATGMHLMSGEASGLNEYELRLFSETWVTPMLRLLIKLEQAYETDPIILALAGKRAQLFQKFGVNEITEDLLNQSVTTKVNVGIGATNPSMKLRNFATGGELLGKMFGPSVAMGANFQEVSKEVFGLLGYKDGARFFQPDFDPRVAMLQQQMQKMQKGGGNPQAEQTKLQIAQMNAQAKMAEIQAKGQSDQQQSMIELQSQREQDANENWREQLGAEREFATAGLEHATAIHAGAPPDAGQMSQLAQQQSMNSVPSQAVVSQTPATLSQTVAPMPHDQMMLAASEAMRREAAMHQLAGSVQGGMEGMVQTFQQTMMALAQGVQQNNQMMAQALQHIAGTLDQSARASDENMAAIAEGVIRSNDAVVQALSKGRRVVRGADGRVEGVEVS